MPKTKNEPAARAVVLLLEELPLDVRARIVKCYCSQCGKRLDARTRRVINMCDECWKAVWR